IGMWRGLWHRASTMRLQLPQLMSAKDDSEPATSKRRRWRFFRIGALSPREQIRYFYLSTVRRAADKGVRRESAETPLEFSEDLKQSWPEVEDEVEDLTDAFLKARYSKQPISDEEVPEIKETWKGVRREIKKRSRADEDETQEKLE
ncbi:MAG: DUF4129 domain-containing protein, partial [Candidatus Promineifilaceae bacterium]|nr:DUF4129 domain-containing protein [Candidatus Promineifilaceae bacterium]